MSALKSPLSVGNVQAPNRMVHQPMECNDSLNGFPSEFTLKRYQRMARGKAGITVVESTTVAGSALSRIHQLICDEQHRSGIDKLTHEFKKLNRDTLLCYQLTHPGQASDARFSDVVRVYDPWISGKTAGRLLEKKEIKELREAFIQGAEIVYRSGADMVDIKLCHNYLGCQMLRPANSRSDEYGGSLENRMRFAKEVIEGIKEKVRDPKFTIMVRFSFYEGKTMPLKPDLGGIGTRGPASSEIDFEEPCEMLRMLVKYGADIINVSGGEVIPVKKPAGLEVGNPKTYSMYHHLDFAKRVKRLSLGVPVIASGFSVFGEDIPVVGENSVTNGYCDMVGIGRQSLVDPDVDRILKGSGDYCNRCMGCIELLVAQMPVGCTCYDPLYAMMRKSARLTSGKELSEEDEKK